MYSDIKLYRKRFIPAEIKPLKDDTILYFDENLIITSWDCFHPREDFASGISVFYRKEGFKIRRHFAMNGTFTRWYCDIMAESANENEITLSDLLIDVIIYPDGTVQVVDLDEAADAVEQGLMTKELLVQALRITNNLLNYIYQGKLEELTNCMMKYIKA